MENTARNKVCMFCNTPILPPKLFGGVIDIQCVTCGSYKVTGELLLDGPAVGKESYLVSAWLRWTNLEINKEAPLLDSARVTQIAKEAPRYRPLEKMDQLLLAIGRITIRPGTYFRHSVPEVVPLAWASDEEEAGAICNWLFGEEYLGGEIGGCWLRKSGWARFEELQTSGYTNSHRAEVTNHRARRAFHLIAFRAPQAAHTRISRPTIAGNVSGPSLTVGTLALHA
jgi:hypothetical protein